VHFATRLRLPFEADFAEKAFLGHDSHKSGGPFQSPGPRGEAVERVPAQMAPGGIEISWRRVYLEKMQASR
jgi:hypothetical protein